MFIILCVVQILTTIRAWGCDRVNFSNVDTQCHVRRVPPSSHDEGKCDGLQLCEYLCDVVTQANIYNLWDTTYVERHKTDQKHTRSLNVKRFSKIATMRTSYTVVTKMRRGCQNFEKVNLRHTFLGLLCVLQMNGRIYSLTGSVSSKSKKMNLLHLKGGISYLSF